LQATEAIRYIHSKEVVHCDVGIHNFLIQNDDILALANFDRSRVDDNKNQEIGLPRYKRSILIRDSNSIKMNDFFLFGMIIYEIKRRQIMYIGKNNGEIRKSLENQSFPVLIILSPEWRVVINKYW
jgi:serine/threonine protein kinase